MAVSKTITANGSKGHHKFTLTVNETTTSGNTSYLSFDFKLSLITAGSGWDWYGFGDYVKYSISIGDNTYTGSIAKYDAKGTATVRSVSNIPIEHETDGTKTINISFTVTDTSGSPYPPGNASASSTMELTTLHTPPSITNVSVVERDARLTALSLDNSTIVSFLSQKRFTITATPYDGATITTYKVYYGSTEMGTSYTNVVDCNFENISLADGVITINAIDDQGGIGVTNVTYPIIQYQKPTLSNTSIKRKTDSQTGLIDNIATLKLNGNFYKETNTIGNANTIKKVEYKIWDATEPSYTNIVSSATIGSGVVTINSYDISNVDFEKTYSYKIIITDYFDNVSNLIEGKVPTGLAVWTEFKDRVDFIKLTINKQQILAPYTLYEGNSSRTDKDITLSDSSANYDCLEIHYNYYAGNTDHYNMVKIDEPNGKIAMLMGMYDNGTYLYEEVANYTVNGSTLERTDATRWRFATGGGNSTRTNTTTNDPSLWITKVVGYK